VSDHVAVEALAARGGRDLAAEGVAVIPIGGTGNIRRLLDLLVSGASDSPACATPARRATFRLAVERAGLDSELGRAGFERLRRGPRGRADPLPRSRRVERIVEPGGELGRFRTFQQQPKQRARSIEAQLRRFMGTRRRGVRRGWAGGRALRTLRVRQRCV